MSDWRVRWGVMLGACVAAVFIATGGHRSVAPGSVEGEGGPLLSDCDGAIEELVIQYVPEAAPIVDTAYREFLRQVPGEVTVHVVCPGKDAFDDLVARVGPVPCELSSVFTDHPMTSWARDRWLALAPSGSGVPVTLLSPREEAGSDIWPARAGDQQVGDDLARALPRKVLSRRSELYFDGGDFVSSDRAVFVSPRVVARNVQRTAATSEELRLRLSRALGREMILLSDAPEHHAGMYMMAAGSRTVVVGDPAMAERLIAGAGSGAPAVFCPPEGDDLSEETRHRFDAVADRCLEAGYRVVRLPVVPGRDGRTYVTYTNVIINHRGGTSTVYMPIYRGAEALNEAAAGIWQELGYRVLRVDCTAAYVHFGSLRCLVNVLRREVAPRAETRLAASSADGYRLEHAEHGVWSRP